MEEIKVLIVDESSDRSLALESSLNEAGYSNISTVSTQKDVLSVIQHYNPDVVLIDVDSPTRDTIEQLSSIRDCQPRPVILITQDENVQTIQAAIQSGVSAYVTDGIRGEKVKPVIEVAMATFGAFQKLRQELVEVRGDLDKKKLVEGAKEILMKNKAMTEPEAHHFLQKLSMNRKKKLTEVAQDIIDYSNLI